MAFDYAELATLADELLTEFGQDVTLRQVTTGAYDPATGAASSTTTDHATVAALFDYDFKTSGLQFDADTMILAGDKQCLMSPKVAAEPIPGHQVIVGAKTWAVKGQKQISPAGTVVLYELLLRQ